MPPQKLVCHNLSTGGNPGLRAVLIKFDRSFLSDEEVEVIVGLNQRRARSLNNKVAVRETLRLVDEGSYTAEDGVYEPRVLAVIPNDYLACS